jgi:hypothetical protein
MVGINVDITSRRFGGELIRMNEAHLRVGS